MIGTALLFAGLQAADLATTSLVLARSAGHESNPIAAAILNQGGWGAAALLKAALVLAVAIYLLGPSGAPRLRLGIVQGMCVAMGFVVLSNAGIALR